MAEEVILTRFEADITGLEAGIAKAAASLRKYEEFSDGAAASGNELSVGLGNLTTKTLALEGAQRKAATAAQTEAKAVSEVTESITQQATEQKKAGDTSIKVTDEEAQHILGLIQRINDLKEAKQQAAAQGVTRAEDIAAPGSTATGPISQANAEALNVLRSAKAITEEEHKILVEATAIVEQYRLLRATGEQFPGQMEELQVRASRVLTSMTGITQEEIEAARAAENLAELVEEVGDGANKAIVPMERLSAETTKIKEQLEQLHKKKLTITDPAEISKVNAEIGGLTSRLNSLSASAPRVSNVGKALGTIRTPLKDIGGIGRGLLGQVQGGLGNIGGLVSGLTGPVGLLATAVGGLVFNATRLDSVQVSIEGIKRGFGGFLDQLAQGKFSIDAIIESFAEGKRLAEELDALDDRRAARSVSSAEEEAKVESLLRLAKDRTKTEEQRIALLKEAQKINREGAAQDVALAQAEAKAALDEFKRTLIDQNELTGRGRSAIESVLEVDKTFLEQQLVNIKQFNGEALEIDDEARQKAVDAQLKVIQARRSAANVEEVAQNRINFLVQEGSEKALAAGQKANEARERQAKQQEENAVSRAEAEREVTDIITGLQDEQLRSGLTAREQEAFDIDQKYDALLAKARDTFAKIRNLAGEGTPGADQAAIDDINKRQKEVNDQITQAREAAQRTATQKSTADEIKARQDASNRITEAIRSGNERQLQALRQRIENGAVLTEQERDRYFALIQASAEAEIALAQEKYARLLDENRKYQSDAFGLTEDGKKREAELIAQKDAEISAAQAEADEQRNAERTARLEQGVELLSVFADQGVQILQQAAEGGEDAAEKANKALVLLMLDTLEKMILINAVGAQTGAIAANAPLGPAGVATGIVQGAIVSALIKALFAVVKGQVTAAYTGEDYVSGKQTWPGRDGHLRRVHTGERIVTSKTNKEHFGLFQAAEDGVLRNYLDAHYVIPAINNYLESDDGRRVSTSVMFAPFHDANIVKGLRANAEEAKKTNAILLAMANRSPRVVTSSGRQWS